MGTAVIIATPILATTALNHIMSSLKQCWVMRETDSAVGLFTRRFECANPRLKVAQPLD